MRALYTSDVLANEIDGLGHLNVRFYMERAQQANRVLTRELGLTRRPRRRASCNTTPTAATTASSFRARR